MPEIDLPTLRPYGVILPVYNEADRLGPVIDAIRERLPDAAVVVVDDGSRDASVRVAAQAGATVIRLPFNLGYGAALQTGYRYAVRHGWHAAVQMDGDGQHEVADAAALLEIVATDGADVALGSRFLSDHPYPVGAGRRTAMRLFAWIASRLTGQTITDPTSGFQALNQRALAFYCTDDYPVDFPDADVLILLTKSGLRLREVPVRMYAAPGKAGLHAGIRGLYYMFKMLLSIVVTSLRSAA